MLTHILLTSPDAVDVFTENDTPVGPEALQVAFEGILKGVNAPGPNDVGVGALTALERPEWAAARDMLISVGPTTNKEALDTIDSAILLVALDHHRPADMLERGKSILHGVDTTRSNRWWDKHQLIVDSDGNASLQFEHSFSDGASWNRWLGEVWMAMHGEDEDMSKWPYGDLPPADASCTAVEASPITFELDSTLDVEIRRADTYLQESLGDALSTDVLYFDGFGKGAIKSWSLSPDATVQMAFQLAYVGGFVVLCVLKPWMVSVCVVVRSALIFDAGAKVGDAWSLFVSRLTPQWLRFDNSQHTRMQCASLGCTVPL